MKQRKFGCMSMILFAFFLAAVASFLKGPSESRSSKDNSPSPPVTPPPAVAVDPSLEFQKPAPPPPEPPILKYSLAERSLPDQKTGLYGLEIVLENPDPTKEELIDLVTKLSVGRDRATILVYATQAAYDEGKKKTFGDAWKSGYLAYYIKSGSDREIRWMQAIGKFADNDETKEGAITKLPAMTDPQTTIAEKARADQIQKSFSLWDGSHNGLTEWIKDSMNDPDSYQHDKTVYYDKGDYLIVKTTFRGKNAFGGVVKNTITAKVDLDGKVLEIIESGK